MRTCLTRDPSCSRLAYRFTLGSAGGFPGREIRMAQSHSADYDQSLALLEAALGSIAPKKPLARLMKSVPDFGAFEWMLTIIGLEIELRVDIPEALADNLERTAEDFARRVSKLPKVDSPGYTLECLGLLAQALLSLDTETEPTTKRTRGQVAHKAPARGATAPRKKAAQAKRAARASSADKAKPKAKPERASAAARPRRAAAAATSRPTPAATPRRR
jgi:hypothetical protein